MELCLDPEWQEATSQRPERALPAPRARPAAAAPPRDAPDSLRVCVRVVDQGGRQVLAEYPYNVHGLTRCRDLFRAVYRDTKLPEGSLSFAEDNGATFGTARPLRDEDTMQGMLLRDGAVIIATITLSGADALRDIAARTGAGPSQPSGRRSPTTERAAAAAVAAAEEDGVRLRALGAEVAWLERFAGMQGRIAGGMQEQLKAARAQAKAGEETARKEREADRVAFELQLEAKEKEAKEAKLLAGEAARKLKAFREAGEKEARSTKELLEKAEKEAAKAGKVAEKAEKELQKATQAAAKREGELQEQAERARRQAREQGEAAAEAATELEKAKQDAAKARAATSPRPRRDLAAASPQCRDLASISPRARRDATSSTAAPRCAGGRQRAAPAQLARGAAGGGAARD